MVHVTQECLLDALRVLNGVHYFNKTKGGGCELLYDQNEQSVSHKAAESARRIRVPDYGVHMR
jgi:hypothetical protein